MYCVPHNTNANAPVNMHTCGLVHHDSFCHQFWEEICKNIGFSFLFWGTKKRLLDKLQPVINELISLRVTQTLKRTIWFCCICYIFIWKEIQKAGVCSWTPTLAGLFSAIYHQMTPSLIFPRSKLFLSFHVCSYFLQLPNSAYKKLKLKPRWRV